jgi:putative PIN family toxin of toxin-antitoxin system
MSGAMYAEYEEVIRRPRLRIEETTVRSTLQAVREKGRWVKPAESIKVCSDPDDDIFLECATAAHADYLVTGNLKHFPPSWAQTQVVTPRSFLDIFVDEKAGGSV